MTRGGSRNSSWFFGFLKCSWRLRENEENSKMLLCGSATDYISSRFCLIALVNIRVFPFLLFCTISSPSTPISTIYWHHEVTLHTLEIPRVLLFNNCRCGDMNQPPPPFLGPPGPFLLLWVVPHFYKCWFFKLKFSMILLLNLLNLINFGFSQFNK